MKGKVAFVLGAGLGYVLGTRAGRERYEKMKSSARSALDHPAVKDKVAKVETAVSDTVRQQGAKVTDKVANMVKDSFTGSSGTSSSRPANGTSNGATSSNGPTSAWDTPQR